MKVSMILEAVDRATAPVRRVEAAAQSLIHRAMVPLERSAARAGGALTRFWGDAAKGERIGNRVGVAMRNLAVHGFDAVRKSAASAGKATGAMAGTLAKVGLLGVGGAVAGGVAASAAFGRGIISTGMQFEQFQAALEGTEGSVAAAKRSLKWVSDFADRTPFDVDNVTEAFVRARQLGIDPMSGAFQALGDAAGGTNKTLMQAVEMLADAQTFEFERTKEFGITASQKGGMVTFSFLDKAGKNAKKTVKKDMVEVRNAILEILGPKFAGGMDRQSKTLAGIMSNLRGFVTKAQLAVADKGIYERVKSSLQRVYEWTEKITKDGRLDKWAQIASDWLTKLWDRAEYFINNTDWNSVAVEVGAITSNVIELVGALGQALAAIGRYRLASERRSLNNIIDKPSLWDTLFTDRPKAIREAREKLKNLDRLEYGEPQAQRGPGGALIWPEGTTRPAPAPPRQAAPPRAPGNAKISLHVTTDRGVTVSPTRIAAQGVDVELNTGRAMMGFA